MLYITLISAAGEWGGPGEWEPEGLAAAPHRLRQGAHQARRKPRIQASTERAGILPLHSETRGKLDFTRFHSYQDWYE